MQDNNCVFFCLHCENNFCIILSCLVFRNPFPRMGTSFQSGPGRLRAAMLTARAIIDDSEINVTPRHAAQG